MINRPPINPKIDFSNPLQVSKFLADLNAQLDALYLRVNNEQLIDVPYDAANFTASGGMTWTVEAGDQATFSYNVIAGVMTVWLAIITTSVAAPLGVYLFVKIPGGYRARPGVIPLNKILLFDNFVPSPGYISPNISPYQLSIARDDGAAFTASVNNTFFYGYISFPVVKA